MNNIESLQNLSIRYKLLCRNSKGYMQFMYVIGGGPPSSEKASNVTIMSLEVYEPS